MKRWILSLAAFLVLAPPLLAQEDPTAQEDPPDRVTLDKSLGWGTDLNTGKIAVDAYLLYFYDSENQVLVINGHASEEAAEDAAASVGDDGIWTMPDGNKLKPLVGEVVIFAGDEPEELRAVLADAPQTSVARVQLSEKAAALAQRSKWFKRCNRCNTCGSGCSGALLFQGGQFKSCGSGGFFTRCREEYRYDFCNPLLEFACIGCTGGVINTWYQGIWGCAHGC